MKKTKILAFILTFAMLLSTFVAVIPVSAATADASSTLVGNKPITIDGKASAGEIWEDIEVSPALTASKYAPAATSIDKSVTVTNPSTVKIANDGEFVYILYQATTLPASGFYFQFEFNGAELKKNTVEAGEAGLLQIWVDKTRGWSGTDSVTMKKGGLGYLRYDGAYAYPTGSTVYEKVEFYVQATGSWDGNTWSSTGTATALEARIPIPESVKDDLAKGDITFDFAVWEKHGTKAGNYCTGEGGATVTATDGNAGFVLPTGYSWDGSNMATITLKSAAKTENPVVNKILGTKITVDGVKNADENWATLPYTLLTEKRANNSATTTAGTTISAADASKVYLSTDGEYLYIFYESTNKDNLYSVYFQLCFNGEVFSTNRAANTQDLSAISGNVIQMNILAGLGDKVWDSSEEFTHNSGTSLVNQFIYGSYTSYKAATDTTEEVKEINTTYPVNHPTRANTQIAVKSDTENDVYAIEVAFPLSDDAKESLMTADTNFNFGVWENADHEYVTSEGYSWGVGTNAATIPSYNNARPVIVGIQDRLDTTTGKVDVRFVAATALAKTDLATSTAGFDFIYNVDANTAKEATATCTKVYTGLNAGKSTIAPATYGGTYFFCYTITGLEKGQSYNFDVACWTQTGDAETTYGAYTVNVTVTVDAQGAVTFTY